MPIQSPTRSISWRKRVDRLELALHGADKRMQLLEAMNSTLYNTLIELGHSEVLVEQAKRQGITLDLTKQQAPVEQLGPEPGA